MAEEYKVKVPGFELAAKDPKLAHRIADALLVPVEAVSNLTAAAINVLAIPLRLVEAKGARLLETVKAASDQVPPERQLPPPPSVAGPILESVKYLEPGNPLLAMYENLLARAMDRDRVGEAHPAFPKVIEQLSPDEAKLLLLIRDKPIRKEYQARQYPFADPEFTNITETDSTPASELAFPQHAAMYVAHLTGLNLLVEVELNPDPTPLERADEQNRAYYPIHSIRQTRLSHFGQLFAKACVPETWTWPTPATT